MSQSTFPFCAKPCLICVSGWLICHAQIGPLELQSLEYGAPVLAAAFMVFSRFSTEG